MQKKYKISVVALAVLMFAILATNIVMGTVTGSKAPAQTAAANLTAQNADVANSDQGIVISAEQAADQEQLRQLAPATAEEAEANIYPVRTRYLLWTSDGVHIMWGVYGNGRFVGTDNLGKRCWGIYGKGVFAGFYDGEFFWGRYSNGAWKAEYLFNLDSCQGKFVVFPQPTAASATDGRVP